MFSSTGVGDMAEQTADGRAAATLAVQGDVERGQGPRDADRLAAIGRMTSGIAHDFRNILSVIQSSLNLIEQYDGDPKKISSCLSAAQDGIQRGLRLISRLVHFANEEEQAPKPANVNDLLLDMKTFMKLSIGSEIKLQLELAPNLPICLLDQSQFCSAILNLVVNARDAIASRGTIKIATAIQDCGCEHQAEEVANTYVHVRVEDDGAGMSAGVLLRIFDRHFTTKGDTGSGLGLPQVHAFVEQVAGRISVFSDVGSGTIFDLAIPAAPADPRPPPP